MSKIDPTTRIEDGAVIGEGPSIGPYCIIGPEVVIGSDCRLIGQVHITAQTTIGARCTIYPFASQRPHLCLLQRWNLAHVHLSLCMPGIVSCLQAKPDGRPVAE
jgi:NDP-sugar pyrophosphorylase family protein